MFEKIGIPKLNEGIIMGVTGAVLLRVEKTPISCLFAETHSNLPDSKAAAKIVEALVSNTLIKRSIEVTRIISGSGAVAQEISIIL